MSTKTDEKILLDLYKELGAKIALKKGNKYNGGADKQTMSAGKRRSNSTIKKSGRGDSCKTTG